MKKILCTTALVTVCGVYAQAQQAEQSTGLTNSASTSSYNNNNTVDYVGKLGVGVTLGEPIGASAKYFFNETFAVDSALGWSARDHTDLYVHADALWHKFDLIPVSRGSMPVYLGVGGLVRFRDSNHDNEVGVRLPIGVSYMFENKPIDVFAEIAPAIDVAPSVRADITGGVGIRFWF
jgi:hypothetical protein